MSTKKIIKKAATTATTETKATASTVKPSNITNVEDFYAMIRDQYNATNEKKITKEEVSKVIQAFSESFTEYAKSSTSDETTCILPSIGRFKIKVKESYEATNPKTGDKVTVPAKKRISFKAFPRFSDSINAE
jgi:nucleoid DNA-binding protein